MIVVIPLAGKDPRFVNFPCPKALLPVEGKPLVKFCTDSLAYPFGAMNPKLHFIILKEDDEKYSFSARLKEFYPNCSVMALDEPTQGAACTVLKLGDEINTDEELAIYLADIHFGANMYEMVEAARNYDGFLTCFKSKNPKYSYAVANGEGMVSRVAEKEVISDNASTGFYYFGKGKYFAEGAREMIRRNERVNNAFYVCPVYNELIGAGKAIKMLDAQLMTDFGDDAFVKRYAGGKK